MNVMRRSLKAFSRVGNVLSEEQIKEFEEKGILVVKKVVKKDVVKSYREELLSFLERKASIKVTFSDDNKLKEIENLEKIGMVSNGFGGMLDVFYLKMQQEMRADPLVHSIFSDLYRYTYSQGDTKDPLSEWPSLYGTFKAEEMFIMLNRVGWKPPSHFFPSEVRKKFGAGQVSHFVAFLSQN